MRATDEIPDPMIIPAVTPVAEPVDKALRLLTKSANHGLLWMGIAAVVGASVVIVVATIATMLLRRMGTEPAQRAILAMESPEADTVLP